MGIETAVAAAAISAGANLIGNKMTNTAQKKSAAEANRVEQAKTTAGLGYLEPAYGRGMDAQQRAYEQALALQGQIDALTIEKGELEVELQEANNELEQFQIDICAVIDTLPPSQRIKYNEWCGVFGEGIPDPQGDYLEGIYTATVDATNYTSYSDEDYTTVTITVDANGWITDVVFDVFTNGALSKYDASYATWLNWDTQADTVVATIISDQNADNLDAIASVSISISGFELAFNTAIVDAIPCLLYTSPSPRDRQKSRMPSSA